MNQLNRTAVSISFAVVIGLLVLLGVGTMLGATMSSGMMMMNNAGIGGMYWMWLPGLLMLSLGALLVWSIFEQKN